ncbi:DNA repair protein rad2 [Coemansia javaensis]|uniref:DNA repair protein rad2 n=1 Tax=Coemansia javaensis TaxID=2761396 RepID=A0A9W8H8K8_9FUNG|nr:DNA repair protein rad2 [Coemansia javaensis]
MGVKGLWALLEPAARPVRLEALAHKRLAVDASIWLYQLLRAMKDDEGNPVEDAHILGFYRRICKLLYCGIRPVFVFDGGAPELKRATLAERQAARGQRVNDARRAAHQLLQAQLKLQALASVADPVLAESAAADGLGLAEASPQRKRKRDEYELPPLRMQALATRAENARDLRMAHPEDLHQLLAAAAQHPESLGGLEAIELDTESAAFKALSPEDQHDLVVALKVRSRQTSHSRLQHMLQSSENAMDFSRQQIDLLVKRNALTQQWLEVTGNGHRAQGATAASVTAGRVAGERNRTYMLARSDQPGGGWTLKTGAAAAAPESAPEPASQAVMVDSSVVDASDSDSVEWENVPPGHVYEDPGAAAAAPAETHALGALDDMEMARGYSPLAQSARLVAVGSADAAGHYYQGPAKNNTDDETSSSGSGSDETDSSVELMDLYAESDALGLISPEEAARHQRMIREKQARDEEAALALPAEQFLDMWYRLVTQPMVDADPHIYDSMQYWLLEEPLSALRGHAWRANRRLEKLPDVCASDPEEEEEDDEEESDAGGGGSSASAAGPRGELARMQAGLARMSLVASYLSLAQRWRERREVVPPHGGAEPQPSGAGVVVVVSGNSSDSSDSDMAGETDFVAPARDPSGAAPASSPEAPEAMLPAAEEASHERSVIFEKSRLLERSAQAAPSPGDQAKAPPTVLHIDSGSEDGTSLDADADDGLAALDVPDAGDGDGSSEDESSSSSSSEDDGDLDTSGSKRARLLKDEQDEYARFVGRLKESGPAAEPTGASYRAARAELEAELQALRARVRDSRRGAAGVEADMVEDIRVLLTLFGVPYITAPMEAEAQCAELVARRLVDGMITDDSDAFLFAASDTTHVYRHFFQKDRYVEMYSSRAIHQHAGLAQRDLVFLACLLGSDYTVGIKGVGPVLAMEILAEFGPGASQGGEDEGGDEARVGKALRGFREWCDGVTAVLPGAAVPDALAGTPLRRRLAQVIRKAGVPAGFPSLQAVHAYFCPRVDRSDAKFEWGFPRLDMLRQFMSERLGWAPEKTNETLVPLARKLAGADGSAEGRPSAAAPHQTTLDAFACHQAARPETAAGLAHSKRVGAAISSHKRRQASRPSPPPA